MIGNHIGAAIGGAIFATTSENIASFGAAIAAGASAEGTSSLDISSFGEAAARPASASGLASVEITALGHALAGPASASGFASAGDPDFRPPSFKVFGRRGFSVRPAQTAFIVTRPGSAIEMPEESAKISGFIDYNDTTTSATPLSMTDGAWVQLTNDGLGAFTNKSYPPDGVTELMSTPGGALDFSELSLGDDILIRNDYYVVPDVDQSTLDIKYDLGFGANAYTLERTVAQLALGSGIAYRQTGIVDYIYMGDENTLLNSVTISIRVTGANATCVNYGSVIKVSKHDY